MELLLPVQVPDSLVVVEREPSALAPSGREEPPTEPTGVRIDGNKLMMVHNEMVRTTDGFTVEKLERAYAILSKVSISFMNKNQFLVSCILRHKFISLHFGPLRGISRS